MPKRSEKRDTAKAEYIARKSRGEEVSLRELAQELGASYQTVRNWKTRRRKQFASYLQLLQALQQSQQLLSASTSIYPARMM